MATFFTHAFVGGSIVYALNKKHRTRKNYIIASFLGAAPDLDIIGFRLGIPYDSLFGHRGITHSLFTAIILAIFGFLIANNFKLENIKRDHLLLLPLFILSALSHGFLDALTNGGHGVAFFAPFIENRYFFAYQPIEVCRIGMSFFHAFPKLLIVLKSEFLYVWIPCLLSMGVIFSIRQGFRISMLDDKSL